MTRYLFFDTETNGLPKDWKGKMSDLDNWPRLVQIAWMIYDDDALISEKEYIIQPEDFVIPDSAVNIHGITQERALSEGVPIRDVLSEFTNDLMYVDYIVGHNFDFDINVLGSEFLRDMIKVLKEFPKICTMKSSTDYCKLPGKYRGYKWPKLEELHMVLFNKEFEGAHDALVDVRATVNCFFDLLDKNVISV